MKYIINPKYVLRHEGNKSIIVSRQGYGTAAILNVIHPIYAMMLSFFNGRELDEIYTDISNYFSLEKAKIKEHLEPLVENPEFVHNGASVFPPYLLVPYVGQKGNSNINHLSPKDFNYKPETLDLCMSRLKGPIDIICNLTLRCVTSCIYCYADRKGHQNATMPIELLRKILSEAHEIGVIRFKLMGGEIMLYPEWEEVVKTCVEFGYQPDISIKKPLSESEIINWKNLEATTDPIQISLDTLVEENLCKILHVKPSYINQIIRTFELLDKYEVPYVVHTVISQFNDSVTDIDSLFTFLKERTSLKGWMMDAAKCSMYNGLPYSQYRTNSKSIENIRKYVEGVNASGVFDFIVQPPRMLRDFNQVSKAEKKEIFDNRKMCSGNLNALYILPDGKVTICEELYWHPHFIIGDLKYQTLQEIWDSQKATELFYIKQCDIPKDSPCSSCEDYSTCRKYKHVCWRDTILAYGRDKWYFPDITCPKAPKINNDIAMI